MINSVFLVFLISICASVSAGLNNFTELVFVEDWLIESKVDLNNNETKCRASIPTHANWFGARIRLGPKDELIKPIWISGKSDQLIDSKLTRVRQLLNECRSEFLFLPETP